MFAEIQVALAHGEPVALVTVVRTHGAAPCGPGAKLLVRADGALSGTLGGATTDARIRADALQALESGEPAMLTYHLDPDSGESVGSCGATLEVFVEPLHPEPRLLVAGSGYVAQALARLAVPLGWRVALLDDRTEFVRSATLPEGVETLIGEMAELSGGAPPRSHDRRSDRHTRTSRRPGGFAAALGTTAGYVGMIGSVSKVRAIFRNLLRAGMTEETLARVHAPIGLDLRAETPDEIALSIAAELLLWRRGGTGQPLKDSAGVLTQVISGMNAPDAEPSRQRKTPPASTNDARSGHGAYDPAIRRTCAICSSARSSPLSVLAFAQNAPVDDDLEDHREHQRERRHQQSNGQQVAVDLLQTGGRQRRSRSAKKAAAPRQRLSRKARVKLIRKVMLPDTLIARDRFEAPVKDVLQLLVLRRERLDVVRFDKFIVIRLSRCAWRSRMS